jgi:two-component system, cell cycle sensor histidine kinase and response regulator CckA
MNRAKRLLVVDDEEPNRSLLEAMLDSFGYKAELASGGAEALDKLNSNIDLVLLDVLMPGLDGLEVARQIRDRTDCGDVPIVMVTALTGKYERLQAIAAGANDFISKPIDKAELQVRLASLLKMKDAQDALRHSEEKYRTLVETARDVIWTVDLDLRYTFVSPSVTDVLGYTVEEIMSLHPLDGLTPDSREKVIEAFQEELASEASGHGGKYAARTEEIERYHKDGSTLWEQITTTFLRDGLGKPVGILGISHDITSRKRMEDELRQASEKLEQRVEERTGELLRANAQLQEEVRQRKQAEDALRDSEQRLELALQGAHLGLWDWYVQAGRAVVNRRSAEIIGYALEEIQQTFEFWEGLLHPEDRIRALETVCAHLEGRTDCYEDEYRIKAKSGEWKWIFSQGKVVERDADGKALRMAGTYQDITSRRQTKEALRQSEERYRTVADFTYDWEYWIDLDGKFVYVSPSCERVTGYTAQDFFDDPGLFEKIVQPDDLALVTAHWQEARKSEPTRTYCFDFRIVHRSGEVRWINHACQPVHGVDARPLGRRACNRDITDRKIAEKAVAEKEARYRAIFENMSDGVAIYEAIGDGDDFVFVDFNKAARNITGMTREDVLGRTVRDVFPGVEDFGLLEVLRNSWRTGDPAHHPVTKYRDKRIEIFTENFVCSLPSGEVVAVFSDETERQHAEDALRASEAKYRFLIENAPVGILAIDKEGSISNVNSQLLKIMGSPSGDETKAINMLEFAPLVDAGISEVFLRCMSEAAVQMSELPYSSKWGKTSYLRMILTPLFDESGEVNGCQAIVEDVTDRKTAEDALRESQEKYRMIFEHAPLGILHFDQNGVMLDFNDKFVEMIGAPREKLVGFNMPERQQDERMRHAVLEALSGKTSYYEGDYLSVTGGKVTPMRAFYEPVLSADGRFLGAVGIFEDVTERKVAEQERDHLRVQLLHAQKMEAVGTLAGGIAHDFNNLLQITLGYSELLLQEKQPEEPDYADLQKILYAAKSGADLVQRLLTFSRKAESQPIPLNLNRKISQVEKLLRRTIPRMIDMQMELSQDLAEINADPGQIEQVLMNLAVNARDAISEGGRLTIETRNEALDNEYCRLHVGAKPGEYVLLAVSDSGYGMGSETLQHIFEPFFTTKELGRGTGLGLAIVYGIVKQHGGHIDCYSELGKGTTFKLYFPARSSIEEPAVQETGVMPAFGTETVLLVDDEDLVRELGQRILTRSGYTVLTAANGAEALQVFRKHNEQISLTILDLIMPEMGGKQCLEEILKIDKGAKVLIASGFSPDVAPREILEIGTKGFIGKPFKFKELLKTVRTILDSD